MRFHILFGLCVVFTLVVAIIDSNKESKENTQNKNANPAENFDRRDASLLKASAEGDSDIVNKMLTLGANIDIRDWKSGNSPLMWASIYGHVKIMKKLVEKGANIDLLSEDGQKSASMLASYHGQLDAVKYLLSQGAHVNQENSRGDTCISIASSMNHSSIVEAFLERRADITIKTKESRLTPLHLAAYKGHRYVLEQLLAKGERVRSVINAKDRSGNTAFMLAAVRGQTQVLEFMLYKAKQYGIELNSQNKVGNTALALAVEAGHLSVAELLLDDKRIDVNVMNKELRTPLMIAALKSRVQIFRLLLQHGVNTLNQDSEGRDALLLAQHSKCEACVELWNEYISLSSNTEVIEML